MLSIPCCIALIVQSAQSKRRPRMIWLIHQQQIAHGEEALRQLDKRLAKSSGRYLFDSTVTMADLFWGVELIRIEDLRLRLSGPPQLPSVEAYHRRLSDLPAISGAVTQWPGARLNILIDNRRILIGLAVTCCRGSDVSGIHRKVFWAEAESEKDRRGIRTFTKTNGVPEMIEFYDLAPRLGLVARQMPELND